MDKHYTPEDLVQFIYNDVNAQDAKNIRGAMKSDPALQGEYDQLIEAYLALPKAKFNPSKTAIQNILSYSERSTVVV